MKKIFKKIISTSLVIIYGLCCVILTVMLAIFQDRHNFLQNIQNEYLMAIIFIFIVIGYLLVIITPLIFLIIWIVNSFNR